MNDMTTGKAATVRHRGTRVSELELIRYGRFADRRIELRAARTDLHVLIGANEAGKTTTRAAISDLLYGFAGRTPYDFRFPGRELRVGATLEAAGERLSLRRRKGTTRTLSDRDDAPLADSALLPFIGGTDRSFFERMFSLDHAGLVQGGRELLDAKDDLGRMLFQSAAGMAGMGAALDSLEEQRNALWSKRRSATVVYHQAETRLKSAQEQLRAATLRAGTWQAAMRERHQALAARDAVVREQADNGARTKRLQRQRTVLPKLGLLAKARADAERLAGAPMLRADAAELLRKVESELALADAKLAGSRTQADGLRATLAGLDVDRALLARATDIRQLDEQRAHVAPMPADLEKQQARIDGLKREVLRLAGQLGWNAIDEAGIAAQLPTPLVRSALRDLAQRHGGIAGPLELMDKAIVTATEAIEDDRQEIEALPAAPPDGAFTRAIEQAGALGDTQKARSGLERRSRLAQAELDAALQALRPWHGSAEDLKSLVVPRAGQLESLRERLQADAGDLAVAERALREQQRVLEQARIREAQIRRDGQPVSAGELKTARDRRDTTWQAIRRSLGGGVPARALQHADGFETELRSADGLADRRHDSAAASAQLTEIRQQVEQQEQAIRHAEDDCDRTRKAIAATRARLVEICRELSLPEASDIGAVDAWLRDRTAALRLAEIATACRNELKELDRDCQAANAALGAVMAAEGLPAGLPERLQLARSQHQAQKSAWDRRETLARQLARTQRELVQHQKRHEDATAKLARWQEDWRKALAKASLPDDSPVLQASTAIDLMAQIEQRLADIREIGDGRIATMRRDIDAFAADAAHLAAAVAPDLAGSDPATAARVLRERCEDAERIAGRVADLEKRIADLDAEAQRAADTRRDWHARLAPLLHEAGVEKQQELPAAIARSDERRQALQQIETLEREIVADGDGLALPQLIEEAAGIDRDTIAPALAELEQQANELAARREQAGAAITAAEVQLAGMQGQDTAMRAEQERQDALATMGDAAERWATLTVGTRLLRAAIDLYRERQQDPLLKRAAAIFRTLTLEEFTGLRIDHEGERPALACLRRSEETVPIDGLSTGTRDQLFLALRIAAVEQYLDNAPGLPFVADDLFINFDDRRAAAGFEVLQRLAAKTQVLFFTHHAHLGEIARKAMGGKTEIVEI